MNSNDALRTTFRGGRGVVTFHRIADSRTRRESLSFQVHGVADEPEAIRAAVLLAVAEFKDFTTDNDPYDEHD